MSSSRPSLTHGGRFLIEGKSSTAWRPGDLRDKSLIPSDIGKALADRYERIMHYRRQDSDSHRNQDGCWERRMGGRPDGNSSTGGRGQIPIAIEGSRSGETRPRGSYPSYRRQDSDSHRNRDGWREKGGWGQTRRKEQYRRQRSDSHRDLG